MTKPLANSGIYFHIEFQEQDFPTMGFEAQLANSHLGGGGYVEIMKTDSLHGIRNPCQALVTDNEWSTMRVSVYGKRIQIWFNDLPVVVGGRVTHLAYMTKHPPSLCSVNHVPEFLLETLSP